ncbi:hypothetical protein L218DRAFT_990162 [Marasmius fiardii PR-910]|nr:hypothetical protein L218DRAFT_990162 [Marasmius fiardii PR-910]
MSSSSSHPSTVPNSHTQNEMLNHASEVTIYGSSFSNIGRDQYRHCTVQQQIFVHPPQKKDLNIRMDLPELDQFTEVKRGDIHRYSSDVFYCSRWEDEDDIEAAVYHAELNMVGSFAQKKFTVKTYRGQNAMEEWRRDFLSCSADWCRDIPLFGYNRSSIPLLIFCGELIPVAHIQFDAGVPKMLGREYFSALSKTLDCDVDEMWMDTVKGKFCRGPAGPGFRSRPIFCFFTPPPADVEFLKEEWSEWYGFNEREVTCGRTRPFSIQCFYFWSHDPTGQNPLSWSMCKYLGLPFKLSLQVIYKQYTWPTEVYKILHDYQIARGFDPRTTDFARSMGYQPWEVEPLETRFQELNKDSDDDSYSPNILFDGNQDLDDNSYSLNILFGGNQVPTFSQHCTHWEIISNMSSLLAPHYARMLASADQLSNSEQTP